MKVSRNTVDGNVTIHLAGTPVVGHAPENGEGKIHLTPYGAKRLAYELLLNATDAEHYKPIEWKDIPTDLGGR